MKGVPLSPEHRAKLSVAHLGHIPWNKGRRGDINLGRRTSRFGVQVTEKWHSSRQSAIKRSIEWKLTKEQAEDLVIGDCHYCGAVSQNVGHLGHTNHVGMNGIDRVDNTKGYVIENCVSCCRTCNAAKGELTLDEFMTWVERLYLHLKKENK